MTNDAHSNQQASQNLQASSDQQNQQKLEAGKAGDRSSSETPEGSVTLDAETYRAVLDKLDKFDAIEKGGGTGDAVQDLADEGQAGAADEKVDDKIDIDGMTQTQLSEHIVTQVGEQLINPLAVHLQGMALEMEVGRLNDEYRGVFNANQDLVFDIAGKNPRLSIKQSCDLAVKDPKYSEPTTKKGSDASDDEKDTRDPLRHLPRPGQPQGEKPGGHSGESMSKEEPKDRKTAASMAIEELGIKFDY